MELNPVALVLGASRGLGLLVARELLDKGYPVVIAARDAGELAAAAQQLSSHGTVHTKVLDVSDAQAVERVVQEVEQQIGPIGVAIHVAGVIQVGPAASMTLAHFRQSIDIMLWGPIHMAWAVLPAMRARRQGHIGIVTSVGGMVSPPHLLPYATAKFGAVGFTDGLAAELAGTGVTATTIVPGLMRTGSHERAQFTGDVAKEYAWFAPSASLPGLSMDAERAAARMVEGVLAGDPMVTLTPLTWAAVRFRGLLPGTTTRLMGLGSRLLPAAPARPATDGVVDGREAAKGLRTPIVKALTVLGNRAAARFNQRSS